MLLNTFLLKLTGLSFWMLWDLDFDERFFYDNASLLLSVKVSMMLENAENFCNANVKHACWAIHHRMGKQYSRERLEPRIMSRILHLTSSYMNARRLSSSEWFQNRLHCCKSICSHGSDPYAVVLKFESYIRLDSLKIRIGLSHPKSEASYDWKTTWYVLQE